MTGAAATAPSQRSLRIMPWNVEILWFSDDRGSDVSATSMNSQIRPMSQSSYTKGWFLFIGHNRFKTSFGHIRKQLPTNVISDFHSLV